MQTDNGFGLGNSPIRSDDPLAKKYLALAERHSRLQVQLELLKVEVEFVLRHLKDMVPADEGLRALIVSRLEKRLRELNSVDTKV